MKNLHLIYGDNASLLSLSTTELVDGLQRDFPDAQIHDISASENLDSDLRQVSLFSEAEIFVHQGALNAERVKTLLAYLESPDEASILVISTPKPSAPLMKGMQKAGGEIVTWQGKTYKDTATILLSRTSVDLSPAAKSLIAEHIGQEVERIPGLIDVLRTVYPEGTRISPAEVQPFLAEKGNIPVWELTDAVDSGNAARALRAIDRMIPANNPIALLAIVTSHIEKMFRLSALDIRTEQQAAEFLGLKGSTYPAKKAVQTMGRYGNSLPALAELVGQANTDMKGGSPLPARMSLEILVGRLCTYPRK